MTVTMIAAVSADGLISGPDGKTPMSWTSNEDKAHFSETTRDIGTVVMGGRTFDTIGRALPGRRTIVMSRTRREANGIEWTDAGPTEIISMLRREGVRRIAVCGGKETYTAFLKERLVDEILLTVEPVMLGTGTRLSEFPCRLSLAEASNLSPDTILTRYLVRYD